VAWDSTAKSTPSLCCWQRETTSPNAEAVDPRHLDIEEYDSRLMLPDRSDRLAPTRALGHHVIPAGAFQARADAATGELLVVDDDGANHAGVGSRRLKRCRIRNC